MNAATARFSWSRFSARSLYLSRSSTLEHLARHADGEVVRSPGDVQYGDAGMAAGLLQHLVGLGQQRFGVGRRIVG